MNLPAPDREKYLSAKPFPHCVIDGVFHPEDLRFLLENWPHIEGEGLRVGATDEKKYSRHIQRFVREYFHSQKFIFFLEELSGVKGLVLDCREIGLHEVFRGGNLMQHIDYTINPMTGLQHRVNAILYLNENWEKSYNGDLELFKDGKSEASIEPIFNRIAIFNIDEKAWHGCPKIVDCPKGMSRKSIALNYFSAPQTNAANLPTTYIEPKSLKYLVKQVIPPIVWNLNLKKKNART